MEIGKCLSGKGNEVTIVGMESAPLYASSITLTSLLLTLLSENE